MESCSHAKIASIRTKRCFEPPTDITHQLLAFQSEAGHQESMIFLNFWQSGNGHICFE
jgi:hypothetical protein